MKLFHTSTTFVPFSIKIEKFVFFSFINYGTKILKDKIAIKMNLKHARLSIKPIRE